MAWIVRVGTREFFNQSEKDNNAIEFYNFFAPRGYSLASICGMLGNIDQESTVNPGLQETASTSSGWGLIQWTPMSNYFWWFDIHGWSWSDGNAQCEKIAEEIESNRDPWLPTSQYPYSGQEFMQLTDTELCVRAYFAERERGDPAKAMMEHRIDCANYYYQYLSGQPVPPPVPPTPPISYDFSLLANAFLFAFKKRRRKR